MVLKDFSCVACGSRITDVAVASCDVTSHLCACGSTADVVANGGAKRRARVFDVDYVACMRDTRIVGCGANYDSNDGAPVVDNVTGETYHNNEKYTEARHDERRQEFLDRRRISRGGGRLTYTRRGNK